MIRHALFAAAALSLTIGSAGISAPCRDVKGKFIKCAPAAPAPGTRCKDGKGRFAKCDSPGATPIKK